MDIEKDSNREAFEAIAENIRLLRGAKFKDGEYVALSLFDESSKELAAQLNYGWSMWLSAKAQAVPEGFVLAPRELSADEARKHAEAMFNKVERMARNEQRDLSESEFELFKNRWIDARTLTIQFDWKAMIEAQEQSQ